jgi:putative tricarboxylic transport membrane protein
VLFTAGFALAGYTLVRLGFETAPLLLGFVLGRFMEEYLRRALVISRGDPMTFVQRPVSAALLAIALVVLVVAVVPSVRRRRDEVFSQ